MQIQIFALLDLNTAVERRMRFYNHPKPHLAILFVALNQIYLDQLNFLVCLKMVDRNQFLVEPTVLLVVLELITLLYLEVWRVDLRKIFEQLGNAREKRMTVIGGGTHSLLLEDHRDALHSVVSGFLA